MTGAFFGILLIGLLLVIVLLVIVTMIVQIVWYVPFIPTGNPVIVKMLNLAELKPGNVVYDLGAGDARTLIEAKKREPGIRAIGYEATSVIWLLAVLSAWRSGTAIELKLGNFMKADLRNADVIFLYLSPRWMDHLAPKFDRELRPGTRVLSHAFPFRDRDADETIRVAFPRTEKLGTIYSYRWQKRPSSVTPS